MRHETTPLGDASIVVEWTTLIGTRVTHTWYQYSTRSEYALLLFMGGVLMSDYLFKMDGKPNGE